MVTRKKQQSDIWTVCNTVLAVSDRAVLHGPPGTGKTYVCTSVPENLRRPDQPTFSVTLTEEQPASELRGSFLPKGGEFLWHHGPAVQAWLTGGRLILNEIDHASPDCWSFLLSLLDDAQVAEETLPTGETVRPVDGYHVIATMNGSPDDLPEALKDRLSIRLHITEPNPAAFEALPSELRDVARGTVMLEPERRIGLRSWFAFAKLCEAIDRDIAASAVFGERAEAVLDSLVAAK